jgi:RHS repeat-associated protein
MMLISSSSSVAGASEVVQVNDLTAFRYERYYSGVVAVTNTSSAQYIEDYDGSDWVTRETRRFIYDGWNLVGETRTTATGVSTNWYVWGLDMSGSIQGAGGVGGLLFANFWGNSRNYFGYDGNGNVSDLVAGDGTLRAHYEYDPFGNTVFEEGSISTVNPFRFSTKYWDTDTKLAYYGFRYYSPGMGRWLNRDPLSEQGGINLYSFCLNSDSIDPVGLMSDMELGLELALWYYYGFGQLFTSERAKDVLRRQVSVQIPTRMWLREFGQKICDRLLLKKTGITEIGSVNSSLSGIIADDTQWVLQTIHGAKEFLVEGSYEATACSICQINFKISYTWNDDSKMHWDKVPDLFILIMNHMPGTWRGFEFPIRISWVDESSFYTPGEPHYSGWPFIYSEELQ